MDVPQILRHIKVYELLFEYNLPTVFARFQLLGISAEQYLLDWFLTLFCKTLSIPIASRVWDSYFIFGEVFLFRTALGIIHANRKFLNNANFEECVLSLRYLGSAINEERLFAAINEIEVPDYVHSFIAKLNSSEGKK